MDYLNNEGPKRIRPAARIALCAAFVLSVLLANRVEILTIVLVLVILPWVIWRRCARSYVRFAVFFLAPIAAALFVVWGMIIKAPPTEAIGSNPTGGATYAMVIALRLAILSGFFQALLGGVSQRAVQQELRDWGLSGDLLVIVLATFAMLPEGRLRADQVLTSRLSRGLVARRSWLNIARQTPFLLRPILGWTLRLSMERAELWHHRDLLQAFDRQTSKDDLDARTASAPYVPKSHGPAEHQVDSVSQIIDLIASEKLIALVGGNFSGRTHALRLLSGIEDSSTGGTDVPQRRKGAFVPSEVHSAISGLSSTVSAELALYSAHTSSWSELPALIDALNLKSLMNRNPTTLSGGEQASLAMACAVARRPSVLAIDCAFEQLDGRLRTTFLRWLCSAGPNQFNAIVADNRFDELRSQDASCFSTFARIDGALTIDGEKTSRRRSMIDTRLQYALCSAPFTLEGRNVSFAYGDREVLHDTSFSLEPANIYLLEGANGAGKSTLAKLLCGVHRPTAGLFLMSKRQFEAWRTPGRHVAYHFQNPDVQLFETTVIDELRAGALAHGLSRKLTDHQVEQLLACFGLQDNVSQHPLDLPFVVRKRVAIAATLASGCPWLILDEPTLGQDSRSLSILVNLIHQLRDSGCGIVVISHSEAIKKKLANPIRFAIADGRLIRRRADDMHEWDLSRSPMEGHQV